MARPTYIRPEFPSDAFVGTATYYASYRVPYPPALIADLLQRTSIAANGRLLDLASGPGRIAIPLAGHFREVWAVDLEPEMIAVGVVEARQRGVTNIRWISGKAEDLVAEPDSFDLITIGDAFHRLDQQLIAALCRQWLRPGGCLAILGCSIVTNGPAPWQRVVADIVRHWRNLSLPEGKPSGGLRPGKGADHNAAVLRDAGFAEVANYSFVHPHDWTIESILGHLYSTSHCSRRVLGKNVPAFERDLEQSLLRCDPSGRYHQDMDCGFTLGRKPAGAEFPLANR
jgi:SAM-dependent methyltransferase